MPFWRRHSVLLTLLAIMLVSAFFRFYGREFDQHTNQHPDERAIISYTLDVGLPSDTVAGSLLDWRTSPLNLRRVSISDCKDPTGCTYPYGSLPVYLERITGWAMDVVAPHKGQPGYWSHDYVATQDIGRSLASVFDLVTILLIFLIARRLYSSSVALVAAALYGFAATAIQIAHFYIAEPFLVAFMMGVLYFSVVLMQRPTWWAAAGAGACLGLAIASKVSVGAFAVVILAALVLRALYRRRTRVLGAALSDPVGVRPASREEREMSLGRHLLGDLGYLVIAGVGALLSFAITEPYVLWTFDFSTLRSGLAAFLDSNPWWRRIAAEAQVQGGQQDVPFTRQYVGTTPVLYHLQQMVFWGMGLVPGTMSVVGFAAGIWNAIRRRPAEILLMSGAIPYFYTIAPLLSKWMRYMLPILPIFCILGAAFLVRGVLWSRQRFQVRRWMPRGAARLVLAQSYVFPALLVLSVGGAFLWAVAFMNIYTQDESRVQASAWAFDNIPQGSRIGHDTGWDDTVPFSLPPANGQVRTFESRFAGFSTIELYDYLPPDQELQRIIDWSKTIDYISISSNRVYSSVTRMPWAYPVQIKFFELLYSGKLGYQLVHTSWVMPQLFGINFNDQSADESFTVYDHPRVDYFKKVTQLTDDQFHTLFSSALNNPQPFIAGTKGTANNDKGLQYTEPVSALPQVDDFQWNPLAQADTQWIGLLLWLLVVEALGLIALPIVFTVCRNLPDRGYALAKSAALLIVAWGMWIAASARLIEFTVWGVLLMVALMAGLSYLCWRLGAGAAIRQFWATKRNLIFAYEALFFAAYGFVLLLRLANPDLWHPYLGGEKPMEMGFLDSTLRSPWMPALDPFFSGGFINYYYYGYFVLACLIKLVGAQTSVAFNYAVPLFYGLAFVAAVSVVYNVVAWSQRRRGSTAQVSRTGLVYGGLAGVLTFVIGNMHGFFQWVIVTFPGLGRTLLDMTQNLHMTEQSLHTAYTGPDFWGASRIIGHTINEFPYWTFLFADLHPHLIDMPFMIATLLLALNLVFAGGFRRRGAVTPDSATSWWQALRWRVSAGLGWLWGPGWSGALTMGLMSICLGALFVINSWDFPTYMGITLAGVLVALLLVGRHGHTSDEEAVGEVAEASVAKRVTRLDRGVLYASAFASALLLAGIALLAYLPFFLNFKAFYTSILPLVDGAQIENSGQFMQRTTVAEYLMVWGIFVFVAASYLVYRLWNFPWREAWRDLLGFVPAPASSMSASAAPQQAFRSERPEPLRRPALALAANGAGSYSQPRTLSLPVFFSMGNGHSGDGPSDESTADGVARRRPRVRVLRAGGDGAVPDGTAVQDGATSPGGDGSVLVAEQTSDTLTTPEHQAESPTTNGSTHAPEPYDVAPHDGHQTAVAGFEQADTGTPGGWLADAHAAQAESVAAVAVQTAEQPGVIPLWAGLGILGATALLVALQLVTGQMLLALLIALIGGIAATTLSTSRSASNLFTGVLLLGGLIVTIGVELVYLADHLRGGDSYRMNTVFKFYVQAWLLFGTGAAAAVYYILHGLRDHFTTRRDRSPVEEVHTLSVGETVVEPRVVEPSSDGGASLQAAEPYDGTNGHAEEETGNWLVWSVEHADSTDGNGYNGTYSEVVEPPATIPAPPQPQPIAAYEPPVEETAYEPQHSRGVKWTTGRLVWSVVFGLFLLASLAFTIYDTPDRLDKRFFSPPPFGTLNGLDFMKTGSYSTDLSGAVPSPLTVDLKYDFDAINWLNQNVHGDKVIAELPMEYYRAYGMRVASATGLSSVVGGLHQGEQRYDWLVADRMNDMNTFYSTTDLQQAITLLSKYDIDYIYLGQLEQAKAGAAGMGKFAQLADSKLNVLKEVYNHQGPDGIPGTIIYQVVNLPGREIKTLVGAPVQGSGVAGLSITPVPTPTATPMPTPPVDDPELKALIAAVAADPTNRDTRGKLVDWYRTHNYPNEAAAQLEIMVQQDPRNVALRHQLGDAYQQAGRPDDALKAWEAARDVDPENPNVYNKLGVAYRERKRYDDAINAFQTAVQKDPNFTESYLHLGEVYDIMGQTDKAAGAYQQCIDHAKPGDPWAAEAQKRLNK